MEQEFFGRNPEPTQLNKGIIIPPREKEFKIGPS